MISVDELGILAAKASSVPVFPDSRFPPSLYYRFLRLLAQYLQPDTAVELGCCGGGASLHLCLGTPTMGHVIGIDVVNSYPDQIAYIERQFSNFTFCRADSIEAALLIEEKSVDILFIDTVHTRERTRAELDAWRHTLKSGAVVCLDDLFRPGMQGVWDELPAPKIRLDGLHIGGTSTDGGFGCVVMA